MWGQRVRSPAALGLDPLHRRGDVLGRETALGRGTRESADLGDGERLGALEPRALGVGLGQRERDRLGLRDRLLRVGLALASVRRQEVSNDLGVQTATDDARATLAAHEGRVRGALGERELASRERGADDLGRNGSENLAGQLNHMLSVWGLGWPGKYKTTRFGARCQGFEPTGLDQLVRKCGQP